VLETKALSKHFGSVRAVESVDIQIPEGQMVSIIGSSGAGKSTLLRMINRLTEPTDGRILYDGRDITALKNKDLLDWRKDSAMIFQQFNLVKRLDVLTNVLMGRLRYHGTIPSLFKQFTQEEKLLAVKNLDEVDILEQALKRCDQLSGGQQQRVAIARAMMQEPKIILADEPIASLDPRSAKKVMEALRTINREKGITVITSLHHLASAREFSERIIGMSLGKVVFDGHPTELTRDIVRQIYSVEDANEELEHDTENLAVTAMSSV
jgi:phosphonate transport system ATP-binding protein